MEVGCSVCSVPKTEGAVFTTYSMAEGAIEGSASDYEVASPYEVHFKYSRFGKTAYAARGKAGLNSPAPAAVTSSDSVGAANDRFPRVHKEL